MAKMPEEVQEVFKAAQTVTFCTASTDGQPNGSIVGMKAIIDDETVYLSDQFFKKTLANFQANPKAAVVFCNEGKAYQLYGTIRYVNEGEEFEKQAAWVNAAFEQLGFPIKTKGGCFMSVEAVYQTTSGPGAGDQIA